MGFYPTRKRKFQKNSKKIRKIKKKIVWLLFKPGQVVKGRERKKIKKLFRQVPTKPVTENSKKIQKIRKHHRSFFLSQTGWERPRKREIKKNRSGVFQPTCNRKIKKIAKKFKKLQNTIIASFQAKIGWERPRKGENKKNRSDVCQPDP